MCLLSPALRATRQPLLRSTLADACRIGEHGAHGSWFAHVRTKTTWQVLSVLGPPHHGLTCSILLRRSARPCLVFTAAPGRWLHWHMGCSASTQNPSAIASSDERTLVAQSRAKRDPPAEKHLAGDAPGGRFEAPFSGVVAEALPTLKVSRRGKLQFASLSPALLILDDLLSSEECDGLVALASGGASARPARQRSRTRLV